MTDQPLTDAELQATITALGKSETELATLRTRHRLAHQARRAKEHQLDGIRRALCDIGVMQDDDPYSHAGLEDVIRQAGRLDELATTRAEAAGLDDAEDEHSGPLVPAALMDSMQQEEAARAKHAAAVQAATVLAGLQEQLATPIDRILGDWPEHNRTDEHETVRNELVEAVLGIVLPAAHIVASRARDAEAETQRVVALYEQWVKTGPPPLGASMARWWDERLVELRKAILGTKGPS